MSLTEYLVKRSLAPGWHTTEFWGKCVAQAGLVACASIERFHGSEVALVLSAAGLEGLYLLWRSAIKTWALKTRKD